MKTILDSTGNVAGCCVFFVMFFSVVEFFILATQMAVKTLRKICNLRYITVASVVMFAFRADVCQDPLAQYYLGVCMERGYGLQVNINEAASLYAAAAKAGIPDAQHNLAVFHENGYAGMALIFL